MKVRFYAGDMHLNRKDEKKKNAEIQKIDVLGNNTVKTYFFLVQTFSSPMGFLACIMC